MVSVKRSAFVVVLLLVLSLSFAACSRRSDTTTGTQGKDGAVSPGEVAGFEEFPLGDDVELAPLNVAGVYFQPVDMLPAGKSLAASQADMHLEADISALENNLGYGVGDFVPYLTVKYELEDEKGKIIKGNFMPMNASDGPHYGANVKFGPAGTYKVRFIIESPEVQGYLLHVDKETGVSGRFWTKPLVAEWDFDYVPRVW